MNRFRKHSHSKQHEKLLFSFTVFQQVIQISGSVSAPFAIDLKAGEKGNFFAMLALCTGPDDVVACLQNATIESINKANEVSVVSTRLSIKKICITIVYELNDFYIRSPLL